MLHPATERGQLTDEARVALDTQLSRRKLSGPAISGFMNGSVQIRTKNSDFIALLQEQFLMAPLARDFLGKSNLRRDPSGGASRTNLPLLRCFLVPGLSSRDFHGAARSRAMARNGISL